MALINPNTGNTKFNTEVRYHAVISFATEEPTVVERSEEILGMKLISDASNGEALSHKDLKEVPDEEIGTDGFWIHAKAAKLKALSQEELLQLVLQMQAQGAEIPDLNAGKEEEAEEEAEETPAEPEVEAEPETAEAPAEAEEVEKPKRKRKKPAPKAEPADESSDNDEEVDVAF